MSRIVFASLFVCLLMVCPGCVSLYHLVPFLFVLGIICTTILAFAGFPYFSYLIWSAYALFCVLFSLPGINETGLWSFLLPGIFLLMHVSYGIGTVQGLWKRMYEAVLQKNGCIRHLCHDQESLEHGWR